MRQTISQENGFHMHPNHQIGHPSNMDSDRHPSPPYQQSQGNGKQLTMSIPSMPLSASHSCVANDSQLYSSTINDHEGQNSLAIPSPISPRIARCPSLTESIFNTGSCPSPADSGPTTPVSNHSASKHGCRERNHPHKISKSYTNESSRPHRHEGSISSIARRKHSHHSPSHGVLAPPTLSSTRVNHGPEQNLQFASEPEEKITKQEKRRRNHLNSEKRRRENIKGGMDSLVDLVPTCRNIQESKANILKKTRDYMLTILQGYNNGQREIVKLKQENQELRRLLGLQNQPQPSENMAFRGRHGNARDGAA